MRRLGNHGGGTRFFAAAVHAVVEQAAPPLAVPAMPARLPGHDGARTAVGVQHRGAHWSTLISGGATRREIGTQSPSTVLEVQEILRLMTPHSYQEIEQQLDQIARRHGLVFNHAAGWTALAEHEGEWWVATDADLQDVLDAVLQPDAQDDRLVPYLSRDDGVEAALEWSDDVSVMLVDDALATPAKSPAMVPGR